MNKLEDLLAKRQASLPARDPATPFATAEEAEEVLCPICGGAGFVRRAYQRDHPRFGKAEPCECVLDEAEDVRASRLQRLSNLGALARFTFDTFNPAGRDGNSPAGRSLLAARGFAADPRGWLVLSGPSGSGKTHLAAAIANERIRLDHPVLFTVVPDLLDHLRASYDPDDEDLTYSQLFEQVKNVTLLVLDDIDAAAGTPWAREKLFQVVNHRYNAELPTVFTTSQRPEQLEDRLRTRLSDPTQATVISLAPVVKGLYQQVGGMTPERLTEMRFGDFHDRPELSSDFQASIRSARRAAEVFAENPAGWLVLHGPNGCGKTHLAAAIAGKALGRGESVFFAVVPDLLDHLRTAFDPESSVPRDEAFNQIREAYLLVLDDLGAHKTSAWAEEKLYQIVNFRTLSRLPTVVTTNLRPDELERYHPRIHSRVLGGDGARIEIVAPSFRKGTIQPKWTSGRRPK